MTMKQQHGDLKQRVTDYEEVIQGLSDRLGIAPPVALGRRAGSTGRSRAGGRA